MSEVEILLVVVAAIYLSECVAWLPKQSIVLTGIQRRLCRAAAPGVLGNDQKQLFLLNLLPTSTTLITRQPSHLFQNESLLIRKLDGAWHAISYQEIDSSTVRADDNSVVVGEHRLPESSRKAANQTASVIQRIAESSEPATIIAAYVDRVTDFNRATRRVGILRERLALLSQLQLMLLIWIFGAGSFLYYFSSDPWNALTRYLLIAFAIWMTTIFVAWRCSRKLCRSASGERWKELFFSLVSPMHTARSTDHLSVHGLGNEHPLSTAVATMQKRQLQPLARQILAEINYPLASEKITTDDSPDTLAALKKARQTLAAALSELLRSRQVDVDSLMKPDQQDDEAVCWCPRCFNQFTMDIERCPDCDGISVRDFAEPAQAEEKPKPL